MMNTWFLKNKGTGEPKEFFLVTNGMDLFPTNDINKQVSVLNKVKYKA